MLFNYFRRSKRYALNTENTFDEQPGKSDRTINNPKAKGNADPAMPENKKTTKTKKEASKKQVKVKVVAKIVEASANNNNNVSEPLVQELASEQVVANSVLRTSDIAAIIPKKTKKAIKKTAVEKAPKTIIVTFQVKYHTKYGEAIFVTGNHEVLGSNVIAEALPMQYVNNDLWQAVVELEDTSNNDIVTYNYVLKGLDNVVSIDWGNDKQLDLQTIKASNILLQDTWNWAGFYENTFYTEPFQKVLLGRNQHTTQLTYPKSYTHIFKVKAPLLQSDETLCILGSAANLGNWNIESPIVMMRYPNEHHFSVPIDLSDSTSPVFYKYGIYNFTNRTFVRFETGSNRSVFEGFNKKQLTIINDGFAKLPNNTFKGAGTAIPVFSLRSEQNLGVGEFNDLHLLVDWSKKVGMKLIQLLPVNDTTATHTFADSYPYAAISAFALHPIYLHLPALLSKSNKDLHKELSDLQQSFSASDTVDYEGVMKAKLAFINKIFPSHKKQFLKDSDFKQFYGANEHWLVPYAAFCYLRDKYQTADFSQWPEHSVYNAKEIFALAAHGNAVADEIAIHYFIQYHLHLQLKTATQYAHNNGIIVKGDIPIGIYRYSCDAWQDPGYFFMDMQAGAPPDDFAIKGQNWGFPTYNWHQMQADDFSWWRKRFTQMSYYFDAFRIDHILGFFRIWSIPMHAVEGILGHFVPAIPVHISEVYDRHIHYSIERLSQPYINDTILWNIFGDKNEIIKANYLHAANNGTYVLQEKFNTQRKVELFFNQASHKTSENEAIRNGLYDLISNLILLDSGDGLHYHFRIAMDQTLSYKHLDSDTQQKLHSLYIDYFFRRQDELWMKEAMNKLPQLKRSTDMLICGEDLGMVPAAVPGVMRNLGILSLEIQRMPKDVKTTFFHPADAPYLSVVTPSTHDMSTIRGWWEENREMTQQFYNQQLGRWGEAPYFCEPWVNQVIIDQHLYSPAMWSIFQLQDLLGIDGNLRRKNPSEERINVPADPKHYWRYKMHITLENLLQQDAFNENLTRQIKECGRN